MLIFKYKVIMCYFSYLPCAIIIIYRQLKFVIVTALLNTEHYNYNDNYNYYAHYALL